MTAASSSAGRAVSAHELKRRLAVGAGELLFHKRQCGAHDIAMMHVRADGLGCVEPETVNEIEVLGLEGRRVRAEVIRGGAAARMMNDEPDVDAARSGARSHASPSRRA